MAKRDVELIIRARDEAAKAIDSVSKALLELRKAQATTGAEAGQFSSRLAQLGTAFKNLNAQVQGFVALGKATSAMDRAAAATDRLRRQEESLIAEQSRLAQSMTATAANTQQLAAAEAAAQASLANQKGSLAALTAERKAAAAQVATSVAAAKALAAEEAKTSVSIEKTVTAVAKAKTALDGYATTLKATAEPSETLTKRTANAAASYEKLQVKLAELNAKQETSRAALAATNASLAEHQARLAQVGAAYKTQSVLVKDTASSLKALASDTGKAAANEGKLAVATEGTVTALQRTRTELAASEAVLSRASAEVNKLVEAQRKLTSAGVGGLVRAVKEQNAAVTESVSVWRIAKEAVNTYVQATNFIGPRTQEAAQQFDKLRTASALAKQEMLLQGTALTQVAATLRGARDGTVSLAQAQDRFASVQAQLASSLSKVRTESAAAATSLASAATATGSAANQQARLANEAKRSGASMQAAAGQTKSFAQELTHLGASSRQALSFMQRLRAQVLSLGSAYIGFFGAARGIGAVIEATKQLQAAQVRLNVIFDGAGGAAAATKEMDFMRRMANRLGLDLGTLANQYTIFASSTQGTNVTIDETRKIFVAVSEAARVLNLSVEDQQGVFKALGQIASKGTLQMEELRGQLGDRMPGALKLMADGLGITVKQLQEQTKQGKISSDALIPFATELARLYGSKLSDALDTTAAKLGMLGQAAFNALVRVGQSGFIESFNEFIDKLTVWFQSSEADAFFTNLGTLMSGIVDILSFLIDHSTLAQAVLVGLFSMRVGGALLGSLVSIAGSLVAVATNTVTAGTAMTAMAGRAAGATAAIVTLRTEMLLLMGSTGLGLLAAGIGLAISAWVTHVDDATIAMNTHQKIVDDVKNAYEKLTDKTKDWTKELTFATLLEAQRNLRELQKELADSRESMEGWANIAHAATVATNEADITPDLKQFSDLTAALVSGGVTVREFKTAISDLAQTTKNANLRATLEDIISDPMLSKMKEYEEATGLVQVIVSNWGKPGIADAMDEYMANLTDATDSTGRLKSVTQDLGETATKSLNRADAAFERTVKRANSLDGVIRRATDGFETFGKAGDTETRKINRGIKDVRDGVGHVRVTGQQAGDEVGSAFDRAGESASGAAGNMQQVADSTDAVVDSTRRLRTEHQQISSVVQQSTADSVAAAGEQTAANNEVARSYGGVREAAETQAQITADVAKENIQLAADYQAMLDKNAEAYARMGEAFEGTPDPFGTLAKNAKELAEESERTGVSVEDLKQKAVDLQQLFSIIDPGGFLSQAQKDAIALGQPLNDAQQALLDTQVKLNAPPGTMLPAVITALDGIEIKATAVGVRMTSINEKPFLPSLPAQAETASTSIEKVKTDLLGLTEVGPEIERSVGGLPSAITSQFDQVAQHVRALIDDLKRQLASLREAIDAAKREAASARNPAAGGGDGVGHNARGGLQVGPGSGTSDSFLSFLSNGEYVIKAAAVKKYGANILNAINSMRLPSFATGGPVSIPIDVLPHFLEGGSMSDSRAKPTRVVNLNIGGETFENLIAPEEVAQKLLRFSRRQQVRSAGRKPGWFGRKA